MKKIMTLFFNSLLEPKVSLSSSWHQMRFQDFWKRWFSLTNFKENSAVKFQIKQSNLRSAPNFLNGMVWFVGASPSAQAIIVSNGVSAPIFPSTPKGHSF